MPSDEKGFLTDHKGKPSNTRLTTTLSFLAAVGFGILTLTEPQPGLDGVYITIAFLLAAVSQKSLGAFVESRFPSQREE